MPEQVQLFLVALGAIVGLRSAKMRGDRQLIELYRQQIADLKDALTQVEARLAQTTRYKDNFADLWADERDGRARDAIAHRLELLRQLRELRGNEEP